MQEELLTITIPSLIGQDERGATLEFQLPRQQQEYIYITRKAGSVSGNTYHTGKSLATNPKTFVLVSGKIRLSYRKVGETLKHQKEIIGPAIIAIKPYVTHQVEALEDLIALECNSISDIQNDRVKEIV